MCSMKSTSLPKLLVTGVGVTTAVGQGRSDFLVALLAGKHAFGELKRPGRQLAGSEGPLLGCEIDNLFLPHLFSDRDLRTASLSARVGVSTLHEAWHDANLNDVDPCRIGLIVGGSNFQQRELVLIQEKYADRAHFLRPSYGTTFLDSDICGLCTKYFSIKGFAYTMGGASASGQLAVIQAIESVASGRVDACIAMGALMDLSHWECRGLRAMGAMGSDRYVDEPSLASRPFDRHRDGFIFGESCGVVVIEKSDLAHRHGVSPYATVLGWATRIDGNRNPNPSKEGGLAVISESLVRGGLSPTAIDYVNPHGSGSIVGDDTEISAIREAGLSHAYINTTKSLIGHGLTAAGAVEVVATVLQMRAGALHPSRNLECPIDSSLNWVRETSFTHQIEHAISLSMGFGGINTALCLGRF
jgi:malonyl-ACP decarboxylase